MLQGGGGEVCFNKRGNFAAGNDLADFNVWNMEACSLDATSLRPLSDNSAHSSQHAAGIRDDRRKTHHVVDHTVIKIRLSGDLGLVQ